jgi:hypothetical protein
VIGRSKFRHYIGKNTPYILIEYDQPGKVKSENIQVQKSALQIWYFSRRFLYHFEKINPNTVYMPLVYYPIFEPKINEKDIDICLLGQKSEYRSTIVKRLSEEGMNVFLSDRCWGQDKLKILSRSKIVLNIHYYKPSGQEMIRILEGVAAGCVVVSEESDDPTNDNLLQSKYIRMVPRNIEKIVEKIKLQLIDLPPVEEIFKSEILKNYQNHMIERITKFYNFNGNHH